MPYCLYVRKSRADAEAEARGEGETLSRHISALLELAKRKHLEITKIYKEIVSGETIAARPVMQQLLTEVEHCMWDGVLVMEVERLARGDTIDQGIVAQTFKYSDTKIITPIKDYDPNNEFDEEYFEFGLFMSRREYKTINRRLQRGRLASVKEGKFLGSIPPYGYEREKLKNDKGYTLKPNPEESEIVKLIFDMYTSGEKQSDETVKRLGVALIVRKLNNMHIKPRKCEHWSPASVRDILKNPVYTGKIRWQWRGNSKAMNNSQLNVSRPRANKQCLVVQGKHEALISEEIFEKAQYYLSLNPPRPIGEKNTVKNPLAGLVICSKCGHKMVRRPYFHNINDQPTLMCHDTACDNVSSALYLVEERILKSLKEWLENYKLQWNEEKENKISSFIDIKKKALKKLQSEREKLLKQQNSIYDLLEQGVYDSNQFVDRSRALADRVKENDDNINALTKEIEDECNAEAGRKDLIPKVERIIETYDSLESAQAKNDMLKEVIEKIEYTKNVNGRWHNSPDDFNLVIYPKIPILK